MGKLQIKDDPDMVNVDEAGEIIKLEKLKREIDERLRGARSALLKRMQEHDIYSLKTGSYTLSRKEYNRVKILDDHALGRDLEERGVPVETKVVLDMDVMKVPIRTLLDSGEEIDGAALTKTEYVSVRLSAKAKK